jgi:sugar phosphate isomerase/epimerase
LGIKLATSTYSFHRLGMGPEGGEPPPLERMIERCADLGLDGIEILGRHIGGTAPSDLHAIKSLAARHGVAIVAVSAHHNFVTPDPDRRLGQIDILAG